MTDITSKLVKKLRERTGVGIMECKKALIHANGCIELAIDNMRKSGKTKAEKKAIRSTKTGIIFIKTNKKNTKGVMIELNCETDFVSNNPIFRIFAEEIVNFAINESSFNEDNIKNKFEKQRIKIVSQTNENININRLVEFKGNYIGYYLHNFKIGVMVSIKKNFNKEIIKFIAMHIAAKKPDYLDEDNIPSEVLLKEKEIQLSIALKSGKNNFIANKIVEGRMTKFIQEICLMKQNFLMDENITVKKFLEINKIKMENFIRYQLGEKI